MNAETIFRILLPVLLVAFATHLGYYVRRHGTEQNTLKKREEGLASRVAGALGLFFKPTETAPVLTDGDRKVATTKEAYHE